MLYIVIIKESYIAQYMLHILYTILLNTIKKIYFSRNPHLAFFPSLSCSAWIIANCRLDRVKPGATEFIVRGFARDEPITCLSLTHLVSLCCRQCPTARIDRHRWAKLPRDTHSSHTRSITRKFTTCSNMSDLAEPYQLAPNRRCVLILFAFNRIILPPTPTRPDLSPPDLISSDTERSLLSSSERTHTPDRSQDEGRENPQILWVK